MHVGRSFSTYLTILTTPIEYIVAPYEADAQLTYMAINGTHALYVATHPSAGLVDAVVTEDSDMLVFGVPKVLYKTNMEGLVDALKV